MLIVAVPLLSAVVSVASMPLAPCASALAYHATPPCCGLVLQVLAGFVAAGAALLSASQAQAVTPVDLFDDRKVRNNGFDIIYEARDLDLDQATRDGLTQARTDLDATKKRIKESEARIDSLVEPSIQKAYW